MSDSRKLIVLLLSAAILASVTGRSFAQSGIFDRSGLIPGHGAFSTLPEESVDLFTGNLTLRYRDIFIPGANGLNIEVWRVYNSKVLYDRPVTQPNPTVQAYPKSMLGLGWTMHMGMIHDLTSNTPVIEFPDGRREMAFPPKSEYGYGSTIRLTRDFLMLDKGNLSTIDPKLYFQNGVVWTFGNIASLPLASGSSETVYMVTRIEDPLGNFIDIEHDAYDSLRSISKITDSMGREVRFIKAYQGSDPAKLVEIRVRNYNDSQDVTLSYVVGSFANGFYKLVSFTPPELPATTYDYNDSSNIYELTRVTTSYGGMLEYSYVNHGFYFSTQQLDSRVVSQKRITFNPGEQAAVWNYSYPTYQGVSTGTATVQGPEYGASATHYAYESLSANRWRIGLMTSAAVSDGSSTNSKVWSYHEISDTKWYVLGVDMGKAKGPLISSVTASRTGDSMLKTSFYYTRGTDTTPKRYGLPAQICTYINGSSTAKSVKNISYYFESHSSFKGRYMLAFVENENDKVGTLTLRQTNNSYFEETGKWGALDQVKRWKDGSNSLIWDYDYHVTDPQHQSISVDGPGDSGVSSVRYSYGLNQEISAPDFVKSWKSITKYGFVSAVWNQYDHSIGYVYDDLGRIAQEDYYHNWLHGEDPENPPPAPTPYSTVSYNWRPDGENKVIITRGGNTVTKYWDGMGRDLGYTENGEDTTLYYLKRLDAEGRVKKEYKGSTTYDPNWTNFVYSYLYDASGRVTSITDPVDETSTITYVSHTKTVTDPENHPTTFEYSDLPGLPTQVTDAQSHAASYVYDAVGRLKTVNYLGRTQSYDYDWLDNVTTESHPETGLISYEYDTANRLFKKTWAGTQQYYVYNASGQLLSTTGAETVYYVYNEKGALASATGSSGWSRTGITYNDFGSVTAETVTISGLGAKNLTYNYDDYGNLIETTYPDGHKAAVTINDLDRPATLAFNTGPQTSIVTSSSYGPNKILAEANYDNGTSWSSTFYDNGVPHEVALMKDSTPLYNATYGYDGAGNITSITSTAPAPAMNASFVYDSLNRLTSATYTTGNVGNYSYEYDAYGNMLTVRHDGGVVFNKIYTGSNQINDPAYQYDARGNLTASPGKTYVWDTQNRLQTLRDAAGQYVAGYRYDDRGLRIASYPPLPDINVYNHPTGSSADITASLQSDGYRTFTITNLGPAALNITSVGFEEEADWEMFDVSQAPVSPVLPNQSTEFTIQFSPTSTGNKTATLQIASNDPDENPYEINLRGFCEPEMEIGNCGNGGTYDFGTETVGESQSSMFYLHNYGTANLVLYEGWPVEIEEQGGEQNFYLEDLSGGNEVEASGQNTFTIRFAPMSEGFKTASVTIWNNDLDENPYTIYLTGTGIYGTDKIIEDDSELALLSPNGGERFEAGAIREICWKGGERAKAVKLEYSTDNGTSYQTIIERAANVGSYPWLVPQDIAGSCLVRISDADGSPTMPALFAFEFNFRVTMTEGESLPDSHFVFRAGVPDPKTQSFQVAEVAFAPEGLRGSENLLFNYALGEIQEIDKFLRTWHHARITYDMTDYTGSVWIDNQPIVSGVPLKTDLDVHSTPEISLSRGPEVAVKLWIDDLDVRFVDLSRMGQEVVFRPLFRDNFNGYERALFPGQGGWLLGTTGEAKIVGEPAAEGGRMTREDSKEGAAASAVVDDREFVSSSGSFKLEETQDEPGTVLKRFSLPDRVPFAVSAEPFAIVGPGQESQAERLGAVSERESEREGKRQKRWERDAGEMERNLPARSQRSGYSRPERGSFKRSIQAEPGDEKMMSGAYPNGTYYIYSFDGRLLAEYDVAGQWIRDYIYFAGRLVAEYRAATPQPHYYFYASDQINSTRIVTDSNGTVVYSAAHEPYGGIQKTWVSAIDPELKFSGKPRDAESEFDYFGTRYYDRVQYRFVSADPDTNPTRRINDLQTLNLYGYCRDNPLSFIDPDGAASFNITRNYIITSSKDPMLRGRYGRSDVYDQVLDISINVDHVGKFHIDVKAQGIIILANYNDPIYNSFDACLFNKNIIKTDRHENRHLNYIERYVLKRLEKLEATLASDKLTSEIYDQIWAWIDEAKQKSVDAMDSVLGLLNWGEDIMNLWTRYDI